jgi:hypothetical protein
MRIKSRHRFVPVAAFSSSVMLAGCPPKTLPKRKNWKRQWIKEHRRQSGSQQSSWRCALHTIKTTDVKIARRFRRKQLLGGLAETTIEGSIVAGTVLAVKEDTSVTPTRWIITIAASQQNVAA